MRRHDRSVRAEVPRLRVRATEGREGEGGALARRLEVPFGPGPSALSLIVTDDGLVAAGGVDGTTDPGADALARQGLRSDLLRSRPGGETIVRAVRGRSSPDADLQVVDATAGWGVDAAALWRAGMQVTAIERDPLMALLLEDATRRLREAAVPGAERFRVVTGEARTLLAEGTLRPDVVYLDPMYPRSGGGAKRRAAAWLRTWLASEAALDEEDARTLLAVARGAATRRVVVKRPAKGPQLAGGVSGAIRGRTTRFDLYPPA